MILIERAKQRTGTAGQADCSAARDADVCVLSDAPETGTALRLREAFPPAVGLHLMGSSRTHTRGGGIAIVYRKDRFNFHSSV